MGTDDQFALPTANGLAGLRAPGFGYELSFGIDDRDPRLFSRLAEECGDLSRLHQRRRLGLGVSSGAAKDHVGSRRPHDVKPEVVGVR